VNGASTAVARAVAVGAASVALGATVGALALEWVDAKLLGGIL